MPPQGIIIMMKAMLEASWQGSLVILLILLLRPFLGFRVPAKWRCLLWVLALIRLLIPAVMLPPSPASFENIAAIHRPIERAQALVDRASIVYEVARVKHSREPVADLAKDSLPRPEEPRSLWNVLAVVWLSGTTLLAAWIAGASIRLHHRLRSDGLEPGEAVLAIWTSCCARLSLAQPPPLIVTSLVDSPALVGIARPALLIPTDTANSFTPEDWQHIFTHELAHFQRRDHWMQALHLLALCVHWFNPLVWIGCRFLRADRELATDEKALRSLAGDRAAAYAGTLLKVVSERSGISVRSGMVGIMEDGAQLKQRLQWIVRFGPKRALGSAAGAALVVLFAAAVLGRQISKDDLNPYADMTPIDVLVSAAARGDLATVSPDPRSRRGHQRHQRQTWRRENCPVRGGGRE